MTLIHWVIGRHSSPHSKQWHLKSNPDSCDRRRRIGGSFSAVSFRRFLVDSRPLWSFEVYEAPHDAWQRGQRSCWGGCILRFKAMSKCKPSPFSLLRLTMVCRPAWPRFRHFVELRVDLQGAKIQFMVDEYTFHITQSEAEHCHRITLTCMTLSWLVRRPGTFQLRRASLIYLEAVILWKSCLFS